jgi:hypothetical protein
VKCVTGKSNSGKDRLDKKSPFKISLKNKNGTFKIGTKYKKR